MKKIIFLFPLFLLACQTPEKPQNLTELIKGETGRRLDSLLTPYVEKLRELTDNTAGLAIGVTKGDEIIYAHTFGYANIKTKKRADFHTLFHIASLSKPFTAFAIAKLVQQGKLNLDDPIIKYIPEFKMKGAGYEQVTIKQILTHTSGIPRHISSEDWANPTYGPKALEKNLEFVQDFELDFEPGSKFRYSNSAFDILGVVVNRASGMHFAEYIRTNILEPAGMFETAYIKPRDSLPENWAASHSYGLTDEIWSPYPYTENYFPSSGVQASLFDMCQWGLLHLNEGTIEERVVLDQTHFDLMVAPHYDTPWGDKIGLSWFLQSYLDHPNIMHTGSDSGFEAMFYIYPEDDISIVVMGSRDYSRTGRLVNAASEVLFEKEIKEFTLSAKYPFAAEYKQYGLEKAKAKWESLRQDTSDIYEVNNNAILTTGAILENASKWKPAKEILEYYMTFNDQSAYAWRLLGNANLNLQDTLLAINCYQQTLKVNPDYEKGRIALKKLGVFVEE